MSTTLAEQELRGTEYHKISQTPKFKKIKHPERHRVMQMILDYHAGKSLKLYSMPGPTWALEHMIDNELGLDSGAFYVGVECHMAVIEKCAKYMPGRGRRDLHLHHNGFPLDGHISTRAAMIHAYVEWVSDRIDVVCPPGKRVDIFQDVWGAEMTWRKLLGDWTAVWIDLCGPIGQPARYQMLTRLPRMCKKISCVPIVVTGKFGRDKALPKKFAGTPDGRAELVKYHLEQSGEVEAEIISAWKYKSTGNNVMVTAALAMRRK